MLKGGALTPRSPSCLRRTVSVANRWPVCVRPTGIRQSRPVQHCHLAHLGVTPASGPAASRRPAACASSLIGYSGADIPKLSDEQEEVFQAVKEGKNVFFTGNAGTGKSFLLRHILDFLRKEHGSKGVAVCASTGIAATHIGGTTIHAAYGFGVPKRIEDFSRAMNPENYKRIINWKVLVIDEVSMVSGEFFQQLDHITSVVKGETDIPFGSVQLVVCGDFFQLPPIPERYPPADDPFHNRGYAFECPAWKRCNFEQRVLNTVFRQTDERFVSILDAIRYNVKADAALAALKATCQRPLQAKEGVEPTNLFSRNDEADELNKERLKALPGKSEVLEANDSVELDPLDQLTKPADVRREFEARLWDCAFFRDCLAAEDIELKVGAQVILLRNIDLFSSADRMLVNGSRGVITRFVDSEDEYVRESVRDPDLLDSWDGPLLPVVRFSNGREETIGPEEFSVEIAGLGTCKRVQIPLRLAWAITMHKSQGMTLDYVRVSPKNIFVEGQAYVALSRARSLDGLEITGFSSDCVKTSELVKKFHDCLTRGVEFEDDNWDNLIGHTPIPESLIVRAEIVKQMLAEAEEEKRAKAEQKRAKAEQKKAKLELRKAKAAQRRKAERAQRRKGGSSERENAGSTDR